MQGKQRVLQFVIKSDQYPAVAVKRSQQGSAPCRRRAADPDSKRSYRTKWKYRVIILGLDIASFLADGAGRMPQRNQRGGSGEAVGDLDSIQC